MPMSCGGGSRSVTGWRRRRDRQHWLEPGGGGATGSRARRVAVWASGGGGSRFWGLWATRLDAETREV
jgi:hypothetical protein